MSLRILALFFYIACTQLLAQSTFVPDTLRASQRSLGPTDSLLQFMNGFAAPFFVSTNRIQPDTWTLFRPGMAPLSAANYPTKPLLFSALPHLGFAYGFGSQGAQRLRLDYEQQFYQNTLLNVRYDRHQSTGFIRSSDLRYSALQIQVLQKVDRLRLKAGFSNFSNDRQWSGGIANWPSLVPGNANLLPVLKNESFTFENAFQVQLQNAYLLGADSTKGFRLLSKHAYEHKQRRYEETDSLELFYSQLYLNTDSCRDLFATQIWSNAAGFGFVGPKIDWNSTLQIKQLNWQDTQFTYDTTELNVQNEFRYSTHDVIFEHRSTINIAGAAGSQQAQTRLIYELPFGKIDLLHQYRNAWPELMQRTYMSNLTQYQQMVPQREQTSLYRVILDLDNKNGWRAQVRSAYMHAQQLYRFEVPTMSWELEGPQDAFEACLALAYANKSWRVAAEQQYTHWQRAGQAVLPPLASKLQIQWKGGVFKNKQLQVQTGLSLSAYYGAAIPRMAYLGFVEAIDWQVYNNPSIDLVRQIYNAQFDLALEVKTFRFFVQATNLLSAIDYTASLYQGMPYPTLQIRLGLSWDFWN